ncbi:MAG: hypothetical protein EP333_09585 [Bacteroidetes bacterium]|nr:MAG: hypothetical protein EP333_09585 [Bacteroidota bacterium]
MLKILPFIFVAAFAQAQDSFYNWDHEKLDVKHDENNHMVLKADAIFNEGWSELAQPIFWKRIMRLSPDSCIVNIAKDRRIIAVMSNADWNSQSDAQKNTYRDSVRNVYGLTAEDRIYVTTGKNDFYKFDLVYPTIAKGIEAFEQNGVDPWYAQAILLIESPGQLKKSRAGAYGPFQLMPAVARAQGLTVNKYRDDREDFEKSAYGASQLLKRICIPEAKRILEKHQIQYNESDLWFRLYVLHVYHAGALNVDAVTAKINTNDGRDLIRQMWINTAANFGNNSQNYSQLALASQLILHELVYERCEYIFDCASNN